MTLSDDLKRYAVLTMIIGGVVLTLSGLCTGLFIASGPDTYVPNALGVLGIGMIGIAPGAILLFSALYILKKGPKILPAILILLVAVPVLLMTTIGVVTFIINIASAYPPPLVFLVIYFGIALLALAMTVFGFKTIMRSKEKPPEVDTF